MMVSTRGRYALRVMIDLAENQKSGVGEEQKASYIPMKDVANRQGISLKYLERILPVLVKSGCIEGVQGKSGGYRLTRNPEEYRVGEILRLTEGDLAPVACLECGAEPCEKSGECRTIGMWSEFHDLVNKYFDGVTLADLMRK